MDPGDAGNQGSRDGGNCSPTAEIILIFSSADQAGETQNGGNRSRENTSGARNPAAGATLQRIEPGLLSAFDAPAFPTFENRRSQAQQLERAAFAVSEKFEHPDGGRNARSRKVNGKLAGILVPHGNRRGPDQHARIVGERKSK